MTAADRARRPVHAACRCKRSTHMAEQRTSRMRSSRRTATAADPKRSSAGTRVAQLQCFYPSGPGGTANAHIAKRSIAAASCGRQRNDPRITTISHATICTCTATTTTATEQAPRSCIPPLSPTPHPRMHCPQAPSQSKPSPS
jgi:hypothetical protein